MSHASQVRKQKKALQTLLKPTGDKVIDDLRVVMMHQAVEDKLGQIMNTDPIGYRNQVISLDLWKEIARDCYEVMT
jgi:hypothetical protein